MDDLTFVPALSYRDPKAALDWLALAFDFELTMAIEGPDDDPTQCHYEMGYEGRGRIMIGSEWNEWMRSPSSIAGANTTSTHVEVRRDIDAHCERARAAGAQIVVEPSDQFYGDRVYRCVDLEGHHWTFAMHVRDVTRVEAEHAIDQPIYRAELAMSAEAAPDDVKLDDTLAALADPVRRRTVELLSARPRRAGELAAELGVSAPAMSRHLRVLRTAELVDEEHPAFDARVRIYSLRVARMSELKTWLADAEAEWAEQLSAFKAHVEGG